MNMQEVRQLLEIKTTEHDNYISMMLPLSIDFVKQYTGRDCMVKNPDYDASRPTSKENPMKVEELEDGMKIAVAKIIEFYMLESGIESETVSKTSTSFSNELPKSILDLLKPYKKAKFF